MVVIIRLRESILEFYPSNNGKNCLFKYIWWIIHSPDELRQNNPQEKGWPKH